MSNITTSTNNTRIPTYFTFDHFGKKIVGSEQNFKMSGNPNKPQYAALLAAMEAHPNYELSAVAPKVKKQTYAGLTCDLMREYVQIKGTPAQLKELDNLIDNNEAYPTIKSWFLDYDRQIPDYYDGMHRDGYITEKDEFRTFRVDRMEAITRPLADKRDGEKEFKAEALTSQEYKVFQQYHGEKTKVKIRFINRLADAVIDQFGKDTVLMPVDDGHFCAILPVELSPPFCAWIATFGRAAKILAPEAAITEMRKFIEKVSDMYKDEG